MGRFVAARVLAASLALVLLAWPVAAQAPPDGQLVIAFDVSIAPSFLEPAETPGIGTPFVFLYALHDALIKPMPGNPMFPSLAESWQESADGLMYTFKLREGLRFHNGDAFTADDVKFSFHRYKGVGVKLLHERVKSVDVVDAHNIRFTLHRPWNDFLAVYATPATGAAWIVPKKYIEKVGEEGFKKQPVGLGPYRFVRSVPGIELVLEANEQYWRKKPTIKRVVFKGVPDRSTRLAMLKTGEADIGYLMIGVEAETVKADPKLRLEKTIPPATWYVDFPDQWNPKSPWHDRRVRLAAALAIDKQAINSAERMGLSRLTGSMIPSTMDLAARFEPYPYDPAQAKRLLAEAGYANGFDAGDITPVPPFVSMAESVANYFAAVGIRTRVRSMERATFFEAWRGKKLSGVIVGVSAAPGNAASRPRELRRQHGTVRDGRLPGDRRPDPAAVAGAGPQAAGGAGPPGPDADARARDARAHLRTRDAARGGTAGRGAGDRTRPAALFRGAVRGDAAEEAVAAVSSGRGAPSRNSCGPPTP